MKHSMGCYGATDQLGHFHTCLRNLAEPFTEELKPIAPTDPNTQIKSGTTASSLFLWQKASYALCD
jgi:hypothetical protein